MKTLRSIAAAAALVTALSCTAAFAPSASAEWVEQDGVKSYVTESGEKALGWQTIDGKLFFFDSTGTMRTGLLKIGDNIYYLTEEGAVVGTTVEVGGKSYTFDENGALQTELPDASKSSEVKIRFGMSIEDVQAKISKKYPFVMPLDNVLLLAASSLDASNASIYMFDENNKMQVCGEFSEKDRSAYYKKALEKAGYKSVDLPYGAEYGLSIYQLNTVYAFVVSGSGIEELGDDIGSCYFIVAPDIIEQLKAEGADIEQEFFEAFSDLL